MYFSYLFDDFSAFDGWWLFPLSLNSYHTCLLWPQMQLCHIFMRFCLLVKMLRLSKVPFLALILYRLRVFYFAVSSLTSAQTTPDSTATYSPGLLDTLPWMYTRGCNEPQTHYVQTRGQCLSSQTYFSCILHFGGWYSYSDDIPSLKSSWNPLTLHAISNQFCLLNTVNNLLFNLAVINLI